MIDHYHAVYNNHTEVDPSILNKIPWHPLQCNLGDTPSKKEIQNIIKHMKNDKAPGTSNVMTDMIKSLLQQGLNLLSELIMKYWTEPTADFELWHLTKLSSVCKGKDNQQDQNNHRGICLKETSAKIVSIIVHKRIQQQILNNGSNSQFSHISCQEAQHALKRALLLQHQHGLESYSLWHSKS